MQSSETFAVLAVDARARTTQQIYDIYVNLFAIFVGIVGVL